MLHNILNLKGVNVLDKKQQKIIAGGAMSGTNCRLTVMDIYGSFEHVYTVFVSGSGAEAEFQARIRCEEYKVNLNDHCDINCMEEY